MEALTEVESEVIDVDDIEQGEKESCLVGRLVGKENWNPTDLVEAMEKAWEPKHGMSSREWGDSKLILFRFDDVMDRDWVLEHQPWHFEGSLLSIKKCGGNEQQLSPSVNVTIDYASYWVRLYDVPISCMNEISLRLFAKKIGILESVAKSDEDSIGKFMRFKISINITKPLLRGITIRVKGKHLWLPLKYESLPIYCFSCGTIGHHHKNCQSYNRNLKYSTCKLRESCSRKIEQDTPTTLPHDIIENILSRVPVKYLIRFKVVSKQWAATISDPRFAEIHLRQYKRSYPQNLVAWGDEDGDNEAIHVAKFQKCQFQFVSTIEFPSEYRWRSITLCNCDGLYLRYCGSFDGKDMFVLWNPSCRAYKKIICPQPISDYDDFNIDFIPCGIYYNPWMKDYKVVISDRYLYAVFSCRFNRWSEVKRIEGVSFGDEVTCDDGVSCNGSFYWLDTTKRHSGEDIEFGIICFDGKDEKFKKLAMPDSKRKAKQVHLTSSGGHICVFYNNRYDEMRIMKKVKDDEKDSWMEFKVQLEDIPWSVPICWISEHEVVIAAFNWTKFTLYNLRKKTFESIQKRQFRHCGYPVSYLENLFIQ